VQRRWVPAGAAVVRFPTDAISRPGWYTWLLENDQGDPWTFRECDIYEQTDDGPAPAAAPAPHPALPAVQPPTIASLGLRFTQTPIAELSMANLYSLGAGQGATFKPTLSGSGSVRLTLTTDSSPHSYHVNCKVRNSDPALYSFNGQTDAEPGSLNPTVVSFDVSTQQAGAHTWALTEGDGVVWVFYSCDVVASS